MTERPEIAITAGLCAGKRFPVGEGGLRLGRSSSNDVQIPDEELSRNHCMIEREGESSIRIIDLASANGTFVNGVQLGSDAVTLKPGDTIVAGTSTLKVVMPGEEASADPVPPPAAPGAVSPAVVDLGLGGAADALSAEAPGTPAARKPVANALWAGAVVILATAIVLLLFSSSKDAKRGAAQPLSRQDPAAVQASAGVTLRYERVDADSSHIYRYAAEVSPDRTIKVVFDDFPNENRSDEREAKLPEWADVELERIFSSDDWTRLESSYSGPSAATENALKSWRITVVGGGKVKDVRVENTLEPEGFKRTRESLEAMANGVLGLHSVMRSREELLVSSAHSEEIGDEKWDQRLLEEGNTSEAIRCYKLAKNDLASLRSETAAMARLQRKIERAEAHLDNMYRAAHAEAERAKGIGDWRKARDEFRRICDMVPDKSDPRHSEAHADLVLCERNIEKIEKGSSR